MAELHESQSRLLAAVTLAIMKRLDGATLHVDADNGNRLSKGKTVRVGNLAS
jgi:hypothetical protein